MYNHGNMVWEIQLYPCKFRVSYMYFDRPLIFPLKRHKSYSVNNYTHFITAYYNMELRIKIVRI